MSSSNGRGENGKAGVALELPLVNLPAAHPCSGCGACCRYLAIEIDKPTTNQDYDHLHWYLTHRGVSVYIDWEGDWYIEYETVCEHLTDEATCGIYRDRPQICSDFDWDSCEKNTGEDAFKVRWANAPEFFSWLEQKRPKAFAKYSNYRRKLIEKRDVTRASGSSHSASRPPAERSASAEA